MEAVGCCHLLSFMCMQGGIHSGNSPSVLPCVEGIPLDLEITILFFDCRELRSGLCAVNTKERYWK